MELWAALYSARHAGEKNERILSTVPGLCYNKRNLREVLR